MIPCPVDKKEYDRLARMILAFVRDHPGCTREEIEDHVAKHGGLVLKEEGASWRKSVH